MVSQMMHAPKSWNPVYNFISLTVRQAQIYIDHRLVMAACFTKGFPSQLF